EIEAILEQLAAEQPFAAETTLQLYSIKDLGPSAITVLSESAPNASISTGANPDQIAVVASVADHDRLSKVLAQLVAARSQEGKKTLAIFDIHGTDPTAVQAVLQPLLDDDVQLTVDPTGRLLYVRAFADKQDVIKATVEQITSNLNPDGDLETKTYMVGTPNADEAQEVLLALYPDATIVTDRDRKLIVATATAEQHVRIGEIAEQISGVDMVENAPYPVVYRTNNVSAVYTEELLGNLFSRLDDVRLAVNDRTGRLVAVARKDQHKVIDDLINQFDGDSATEIQRDLAVYRVLPLDGLTVKDALEPMVSRDVIISAGRRSDQILVSAPPDEQQQIAKLVQQITMAHAGGTTLQLYSIKDLGPSAITVLSESAPNASVSAGANPDQVAVVASAADHDRLSNVLAQLVAARSQEGEKTLEIFDIHRTDPVAVQAVLEPLLESGVELTVDSTGRRLYVRAFAEQHDMIKATVEQITSNLQQDGDLETRTYVVGAPNADEAQEVLLALYPEATIVTDSDRKLIVATATVEQHVRIAEITEQIAGVDMVANSAYPVVYRTNNVSAAYTEELLGNLFSRLDDVRLAVNDRTGRVVAVAREDQHKVIQDMISQFDADPTDEIKRDLAVYRVLPLDGLTVKEALEPLVSKDVTISSGERSDQILVSAPPDEQQQIASMIQQITMSRVGAGVETRTYQMSRGEADEAQEALQALFPNATLVTDAGREVLVATASAEEHETIDQVVQQMTGTVRTANSPVPKTYRLKQADGYVVLDVLEDLFLRDDEVRLSLDEIAQTVVAVARPDQHETIAALLEDLDPQDGMNVRRLEMYPVDEMDGGIVSEVVDSVVQEKDRGAKVVFEAASDSLLVTTTVAGHEAATNTIERFRNPEPRQIEVFQLAYLEPRTAQTAIDSMISSRFQHAATRPNIHADEDMQQLWVQASASQIAEMRSLMVKMGEVGLSVGADSSNRNLRVIPVGDDVGGAIKRIQDLWPKLRKNPIRVLRPGQKSVPGQFSVPPEDLEEPQGQGSLPATETDEQATVQDGDTQIDAPVVIMPGDGRLTIASDDPEALDQMESLLRAIYSRPAGGRNRDFSIYQLTNAGASDVTTTLQQVFDDTEGLVSFGHVVMVPDERLNSLIVYASRSDRSRIEQLLEVLDSDQFEDTRRAYVTIVIPVQYTDAGRIEDVLKGVYRPQLTAGGARSTISIPKGVPSQVATVLRQINAAAAAPLLTIEVQTDTNSLVVKAPQDLLDEVSELVTSLDEVSQTSRARGLTLLPLKKIKAGRVMEILGDVLN
ncbi:MAG: hypothetical protein GY903_08470, partial [Fuerstiella sp.]|nr:hypothetical protein [Fuerstiella sp.]